VASSDAPVRIAEPCKRKQLTIGVTSASSSSTSTAAASLSDFHALMNELDVELKRRTADIRAQRADRFDSRREVQAVLGPSFSLVPMPVAEPPTGGDAAAPAAIDAPVADDGFGWTALDVSIAAAKAAPRHRCNSRERRLMPRPRSRRSTPAQSPTSPPPSASRCRRRSSRRFRIPVRSRSEGSEPGSDLPSKPLLNSQQVKAGDLHRLVDLSHEDALPNTRHVRLRRNSKNYHSQAVVVTESHAGQDVALQRL
jgi:hypothetical protein